MDSGEATRVGLDRRPEEHCKESKEERKEQNNEDEENEKERRERMRTGRRRKGGRMDGGEKTRVGVKRSNVGRCRRRRRRRRGVADRAEGNPPL